MGGNHLPGAVVFLADCVLPETGGGGTPLVPIGAVALMGGVVMRTWSKRRRPAISS